MEEGGRQRGPPRGKGGSPEGGGAGGSPEGGGAAGGGGGGGDGGVALKKEIGLLSACGIIVGNIIGSGIFVSPRGVLANAGCLGVALAVWAATGAMTVAGALCYAELGVTIPRSGGDYAYVKEIFGGLVGVLRLWISVLVIYPTNQAVIALTFATYALRPLLPACPLPPPALRLLAAACLLLLTWLNGASARWATRLQDACTAGKLLALGLIVLAGGLRLAQGHWEWLAPPQAFSFWARPTAGGLALAFLQGSFAYGGWNFLNYVTEELVDPYRNLPRAIFISIPLVTFVYVAANVAYATALSPPELLEATAVAVSFGERALGALAWVMPAAVVLSTFGSVNGSLFTGARLVYAGAREGQLPALLGMIQVGRHTPLPALLLSAGLTLLMLATGDVYTLINYVGFVNHLWYGVTVAGLLVLRWRQPHRPRPIRVWACLPVLYLVLWAGLLVAALVAAPAACGVGLGVMATGAPLYLLALRPSPRPPALRRATHALTHFGQRLCLVVYPTDGATHGETHGETHGAAQPHGETHGAPHSAPPGEQQPLTSQPHV